MASRWTALGLTLSLVTACGGGASDESAGESADSAAVADSARAAGSAMTACDLASAAELSRIIGIALQEGTLASDYLGVSQCRWKREAGTDDGVAITHRGQGDMGNYTSVPGSRPAAGIGDEAVWNPDTDQMAVRKGTTITSISFLFDGREAWAREIAGVILERLAAASA